MAPKAKPSSASSKASKAAASLKKGSGRKKTRVHTKVHFFRPKTLQKARAPVVLKSTKKEVKSQMTKAHEVIRFPLTSDSAMKRVDADNTLVFIVNVKSTKDDIKKAVKHLYDIVALKVNTLIRPDGQKKAYVKLTPDYEAVEVASRLGMI